MSHTCLARYRGDTVSIYYGCILFTSMFSFDKALSALVCDARFGRDPCVFLLLFLFIIGFWGLFVNFLPKSFGFARDTSHVVQWFAFSCAQTVSGLVEGSPGCAIMQLDCF